MDKRQVPELMKIVIDNAQAPDMQGSLKDLQRDLNSLRRTIESATNNMAYSQDKWKNIITSGSQQGFAKQEITVSKEDAENAFAAVLSKTAQMGMGRDWQYNVSMQAAPTVTGTMKLAGEDAFKIAQARAQQYGGDVWRDPTKKNPDRVRYFYQTDDPEILDGKHKTDIFKEAKGFAKGETMLREEKAAEIEHKNEEKRITESTRKMMAVVKPILGLLTIAVDLLRRIAVSSLSHASEIAKTAIDAHDLGMSVLDARSYNLFDKAKGLPAGTSMGAVKSIQNMFGDVTSLDEKALATLARVMGSDVASLVTSGMGGDNPDLLLEKILDKYFMQFKQGKNSLGQTVGQEAARRELVSVLNSVSPEIAALFSRMVEDYMTGAQFDSSGEWRGSVNTNRSGLTSAEATYAAEIGRQFDDIAAGIEDIKTSFLTRFANSLGGIVEFIANLRIGMSPAENYMLDLRNIEKNKATQERLNTEAAAYMPKAKATINFVTSKLKGAGRIPKNFDASTEDILRFASGDKSAISLWERDSANLLLENIAALAAVDDSGANAVFRLAGIKEFFNKALLPELGKEAGQKVGAPGFSPAEESVGAMRIMDSYLKGIIERNYDNPLGRAALEMYLTNNEGVYSQFKNKYSTGKNWKTAAEAIQAKRKELGRALTPAEEKALLIPMLAKWGITDWLAGNATSSEDVQTQMGEVVASQIKADIGSAENALYSIAAPYMSENGTYRVSGRNTANGSYEVTVNLLSNGKEVTTKTITTPDMQGKNITETVTIDTDKGLEYLNAGGR